LLSLKGWECSRRANGSRLRLFPLALFAALLLGAIRPGCAEPGIDEARDRLEPLEIVTSSGPHAFSVEVMRTEPQRQRGLMFRRSMPQDRGMLFIFDSERPVAMWMKNTYLPLDMIFIARTGRVVGLAENAEPLSERIIPSGAPAHGVLELNAGGAAKIGLKIGDSVRHPSFSK
jgi:hypothetical protein